MHVRRSVPSASLMASSALVDCSRWFLKRCIGTPARKRHKPASRAGSARYAETSTRAGRWCRYDRNSLVRVTVSLTTSLCIWGNDVDVMLFGGFSWAIRR